MHIWEKVSEQQQSRGCAAWRIRVEDRGCCCSCSCSLTDETGKSSGHIHMLIEKGLSSWQIAYRPYVTVCLSHMLMGRDIHTNTLKERAKALNRLGFWFPAGSASLCLQTFGDKWPYTHIKWESSQKWDNWLIFHKAIEQKEVSSWQDGRSNRTPSQGHLRPSP